MEMKKPSAELKAGTYFTICNCIQRGIQFLALPLYTRVLTTAEYGTYTVFVTWFNIFAIICTLNVYQGVFNNAMMKYESDRRGFLSSVQSLCSCITIAVLGISLLVNEVANGMAGLTSVQIILIGVQVVGFLPIQLWSSYERFEYRYKTLLLITIGIAVSTPIAIVAGVLLMPEDRALGAILGNVLVQFAFGICVYVRNLQLGRCVFKKEYWSYALRFNIPLLPHYLAVLILAQVNRIMIDGLCGADAAGVYSLAHQISLALNVVITGVNAAFVPWTYRILAKKQYDKLRSTSMKLVIAMAVISLVIVLLSPELICLAGGPEYSKAVWVMPPIIVSTFFAFVYTLFVNVEFFYEKKVFIAFATCFAAALNVGLNFVFIPIFGFVSASCVSMACYILLCALHWCFMAKIKELNNQALLLYDVRAIIALSIVLMASCVVACLLFEYAVVRWVIVGVVAIVAWCHRYALIGSKELSDVDD